MSKNEETPKFSVVVPVYNTENYLDEAVQSVLAQSETSFEILLVDDGSTDNSGEKCDKWAEKDNRIKVFHQNNKGQIAARECGINNACGEYIIFLDSDDLLIDTALELLSNEIHENPSDCYIYGFQLFTKNDIGKAYCDEEKAIITNLDDLYEKIIRNSSYNSMCRKAFRRSAIPDVDYRKYYHLRFGEDLVQSIILLQSCHKITFLNVILYKYRMVSTSVSHRIIEKWESRYSAREAVLNLFTNNPVLSKNTLLTFKRISTKKFVGVIIEILSLNTQLKNKIDILYEIKDGKWNKEYISKDIERKELTIFESIVLCLFENGGIYALALAWSIKKLFIGR